MDAREKEQYLREYYILKSKGKPFFPYAVFKDGAMACIVMLVIILMSIFLGAELGPKADPTSTTYVPRPEWYYFFLFELLRVIKPPALVFIATVGVPTIAMVLLVLLPFIDRNPNRHPFQRPVAMIAGVLTIAAMAYLTILGAIAGSPTLAGSWPSSSWRPPRRSISCARSGPRAPWRPLIEPSAATFPRSPTTASSRPTSRRWPL